jgi:NAD(P)-dependent dehydrogenase (short-subunit alcohol dehydrogenase family)
MGFLESLHDLEGKVAVLTGGGGILAGEMAAGFVDAGVRVVLLDIDHEKVIRRAEELSVKGGNAIGLKCNVLDENDLENVHRHIIDTIGHIDILVNAAGGNMPVATVGLDECVFDLRMHNIQKVLDLNLNGTVLPTLHFGKSMAERNSGSIINISSMASFLAVTRVVGYSMAKAAVDNFTRWMAVELATKFGSGIRINAIAPGFLLTDQNRSLLTGPDGSFTERGRKVIEKTPFGRLGEPQELVGTVLWLSGGASKFVTGTVIPVDGGFSVFSGV